MKFGKILATSLLTASIIIPSTSASAHVVSLNIAPAPAINKAREFITTGETEKARGFLERALKSDLTNQQLAVAHNIYCVSYILDEYWEEAMSHCNQAIRLVSRNWRFYNNRGNIYLEMGQFDRAIQEYNVGLKLAPKSLTIKGNLELALSRASGQISDGA